MGCGISCINRRTMPLFGRNSSNDGEARARLDRKLYIAKESPEVEFDLSDCLLRQIPSGTFSLCKVYRKEYLYLQSNKLQSLEGGGAISDLYLIKILNLNSNKITHIPNDIRYLVNLTELHLQDNLLKEIPECIDHLQSLSLLDVSQNKLRKLTPALGKLKNLRKINMKSNLYLQELCSELCYATNIIKIDLDENNFTFPPKEICIQGTEAIMKYLCKTVGIEYDSPSPVDPIFTAQSTSPIHNPFAKTSMTWEDQEALFAEQENRLHKAAQDQRKKFLTHVVQSQHALDSEIMKVHEAKESERQNLLKIIQDDEKQIECLVTNFIQSDNLKPEVIQQQLAFEQIEHEKLLEISRQNYDNLRRSDVLRAMENLIEENYLIQNSKKSYTESLNSMKERMLMQDLEGAGKMEDLLKAKDQSRSYLVDQLLEDQDVQKALVASLLERTDTKSWSLNQEISLISSNLARISAIEQEKKKLNIAYNYNELLHQRVHLINLLDDLFSQKNKRRKQLIDTLKEMETESKLTSTDFWLQSYQKLLDTAPKTLLDVSKSLDPLLANHLLQEGVIHCLPFLVKFLFSNESVNAITSEKLKANGVSLSSDREGILRAIKCYVEAKSENHNYEISTVTPSAPPEELVNERMFTGVVNNNKTDMSIHESECVVCMDARCEVVFVPCGHMCCCQACTARDMENCPMCRADIEKIMKVIQP